MKRNVAVSAVVVTYEGKDLAIRCLESLEQSLYSPLEIILVDNGSSDGTSESVQSRFPSVRVVCNERNLFLAQARNIGIRESRGEFVFLIDNDNVVDASAVGELVDVMNSGPNIGMVGPVAYYLDAPERVWSAGSRIDMITSLCTHLDKRDLADSGSGTLEVDCFPNAFMVRKSVAVEIGLLDSKRYPAGFHESDFGERTRAAGYRVLLAPKAKVYHDILPAGTGLKGLLRRMHFGGVGDSGRIKAYFHGRNRMIFMRQHAGWRFWIFLSLFFLPLVSFYSLVTLLNGRPDLLAQYLKGVRDGIAVVFGSGEAKARL